MDTTEARRRLQALPHGPNLFEQINAHGVLAVAAALGLTVSDRRGGGIGPCPVCDAPLRHTKRHDRRLAIGVRPDGQGWRCFQCEAGGDAIALAAAVTTGSTKPSSWADVLGRCAAAELCDASPASGFAHAYRQARRSPVSPPHPLPPNRPPLGEVQGLWKRCRSVLDDDAVSGWLRSRGFNPGDVADRDLARALPQAGPLPPWARGPDGDWRRSCHTCVLPLFDATGALVSLRARAVRDVEGPKALAPAGFEVRGLVLADPLARLMLAGASLGDGNAAADLVREVGLIIAEGEPDFLTWATHWSDAAELAPAVLGIIAGSWTDDLAARVPTGTVVALRTHHDKAGDEYARRIASTLSSRCRVRRLRMP